MSNGIDHEAQTFFTIEGEELTPPKNSRPDDNTLAKVVAASARIVIVRHHRGCPPKSCDYSWESFHADVQMGALKRAQKFRYGLGKYTLAEYCYLQAFGALRDIQRKAIVRCNREKKTPKTYPLWEPES